MFQFLGTAFSVVSAISEGRAKANEAAYDKYQMQLNARQTKIEAFQKSNARLRDFQQAESNNLAYFAFLNRDPNDRSLKNFMTSQEEIATKDAAQISSTGMMKASQQIQEANMAQARGRNAMIAGYLGAGSAIVGGFYRSKQTKT
tara:strand:+ start:1091 stop:1525 length:435 start_codon:yes stop_codon:yes gene_type:complete